MRTSAQPSPEAMSPYGPNSQVRPAATSANAAVKAASISRRVNGPPQPYAAQISVVFGAD